MAQKDYSKFKKSMPHNNSAGKSKLDAYDINLPFRGNTDGVEIKSIATHLLVPFQGETPFASYAGTEKFETLVRDIEENGILTPIIVRARENGTYEILGGEHRTKAAKKLNLATVPAVVYPVDTTDNKAMLIHINTNILNGRDELSFLEKVHAMVEYEVSLEKQQGTRTDKKEKAEKFDRYQQLADVFHIGNKTTAIQYVKAGKEMPADILKMIDSAETTFSAAYKILTQPDESFREELYTYLRNGNKLSIRMIDDLAAEFQVRTEKSEEQPAPVVTEPPEEESPYSGFQPITEFDTSVVAKHEDAVVEKSVDPAAEVQPKGTTLKAEEFDKVISNRKKKKVVTLKVEKELIPARFLNLNDEEKSNLIVSLLRSWENDYWDGK